MRRLHWNTAVTGAAVIAVLMLPGSASADTGSTGRDFGSHVVMCAQGMGFDGQHNPGMHHGFAGWVAAHIC